MKVYVKSRNTWEDYAWLPSAPPDAARLDAAPGETARLVGIAKGPAKGCAAVLPNLPTPRLDFCNRQIDDRLVVTGLTTPQAERLLALYRQDIRKIAALVEACLQDTEDGAQTLSPQLERDVAALLLAPPPGVPAQAPDPEPPRASAAPAPAALWKDLLLPLLRIALLLALLSLLLTR